VALNSSSMYSRSSLHAQSRRSVVTNCTAHQRVGVGLYTHSSLHERLYNNASRWIGSKG
jgi:hypothetical protein